MSHASLDSMICRGTEMDCELSRTKWRELALRAWIMAFTVSSPEAAQIMQDVAERYERLALRPGTPIVPYPSFDDSPDAHC